MSTFDITNAIVGINGSMTSTIMCYAGRISVNNGIWQGDNPLTQSLPIFVKQLSILIIFSRGTVLIFRRFGLPSLVTDMLGVLLVGPFMLGRWPYFSTWVFPYTNVLTWETLANIGMMYHAFMVGMESDLKAVIHPGRKTLVVVLVGFAIPFTTGVAVYYLAGGGKLPLKPVGLENVSDQSLGVPRGETSNLPRGAYFCGLAFATSSFSSLSEVLARNKLLHADVGKLAITSAMLWEVIAWVMLALGLPMTLSWKALMFSVINTASVWVLCYRVLGPILSWMLGKAKEGEVVTDINVCMCLATMMMAGFSADLMGIHSIIGSFMLAQGIPDRLLQLALIDKLNDMVSGLFMPLFMGLALLKVDPANFRSGTHINSKGLRFVVVLVLASTCKLISVVGVTIYQGHSIRDSLTLGMASSSKGPLSIILLHLGIDTEAGYQADAGFVFTSMIAALLLIMASMNLVMRELVKPARKIMQNAVRSVEEQRPENERRVLTPIYNMSDVAGIISILNFTNPTEVSPINVYALRLNELTKRSTAHLFVEEMRKPTKRRGKCKANSTGYAKAFAAAAKTGVLPKLEDGEIPKEAIDEDAHIIESFERFEEENKNLITLQLLTTTSPYMTMHEDVCSLSEDMRIALIILPFHQQQKINDGLDDNSVIRGVNQNILNEAPCSVALFVDRNFVIPHEINNSANAKNPLKAGKPAAVSGPYDYRDHGRRFCVLFFGGPDDREALYYALRLKGHPNVSLTVIRFVMGKEEVDLEQLGMPYKPNPLLPHAQSDYEKQKELDDIVIDEFHRKTEGSEMVRYYEMVSRCGEDTVSCLKNLEHNFDMYIVGKGERLLSPLTMGLNDWSDWPELGAIGDILVTSDFSRHSSVMVIQQHIGTTPHIPPLDGLKLLDGSVRNHSEPVNRVQSRRIYNS